MQGPYLAKHLVLQLVAGSLYPLLADRAEGDPALDADGADGTVLEEHVGAPQRLLAHLALQQHRVTETFFVEFP